MEKMLIKGKITHCRAVQECPVARGKISIFATFGGHLGVSCKMKSVNMSKTIRDRAILSEFFTNRLVQEYPVPRRKLSIFATSCILAENEKL